MRVHLNYQEGFDWTADRSNPSLRPKNTCYFYGETDKENFKTWTFCACSNSANFGKIFSFCTEERIVLALIS